MGRPLSEALESLRAHGLNLIYSSTVVDVELVVATEPQGTDPRVVLDEVLLPFGLQARDGPGNSVLVVRALELASGRLRGRVLSEGSFRAIGRASVAVVGSSLRTWTRPDGSFEFSRIAAGPCTVAVEALGFANRAAVDVRIAAGGTAVVSLMLAALPRYVEELVVTPSRHSVVQEAQASKRTVRSDDALLVPTIGGDVSRVVELLPGVAGADNSAAFNVRGSASRDVAFVLDGLELYEPFHLKSFQSPFSFLDSQLVDTIDFLGGGFTADLGDRHGGFVELTTALPADPRQARIELGTLNSRASFGTSLPTGSLLVSGRAWYPEAVRNTMELGENGVNPRFGDAYLKASIYRSPISVLSAHALLAFDRVNFTEKGGNATVAADDHSAYLWLRLLHSWSAAVSTDTTVSAGRLERLRQGVADPEDQPILVRDARSVSFLGLRNDVVWQISSSRILKGGFDVRPLDADYRYSAGAQNDSDTLHLTPSGATLGAYVAYRAAISERLGGEVGLRWDRQTYASRDQLSPRVNASWRVGDRSELRFGIGSFFQSQRIYELAVEDRDTSFRPAELSRQVELTFQHRFADGLHARLDVYDQELSRVHPRYENLFNPIELFPEAEPDRVLVAPTAARLRGVEILLQGDPIRAFHWWASYVWSSAEDEIDGVDVPRSWDQPHAGKFLAAYRWNPGWSVSLSGTLHTGWPTTPVTGESTTLPGGEVGSVAVRGPRNSERYPAYARLDLKASRAISLARGRLRFELEALNVTNRKNVCCVDEILLQPGPNDTVQAQPQASYWLGITPSFSVLWEF